MGGTYLKASTHMLTHAEIVYREGIPNDTLMVQVPATPLWMRCKVLKNLNWTVELIDPVTQWKKEVWRSVGRVELERIISHLFSGSPTWLKDARPEAIRAYLKSLYSAPKPHTI